MAVHDRTNIIVRSVTNDDSRRSGICIEFYDVKQALIFEIRRSSSQTDIAMISSKTLLQIYNKYYAINYNGYNCLLIGVLFNEKAMSCQSFILLST
mmetsp:Transcript_52869/g.110298  ORF Transcript_52869/g.110298 Transcript_52869/m.110298 type:complete len:96 (-) Transcript_52869:270-557(-)